MPCENRRQLGNSGIVLLKSLMSSVWCMALFSGSVPRLRGSITEVKVIRPNWNIEDPCGIEGNGKRSYGGFAPLGHKNRENAKIRDI